MNDLPESVVATYEQHFLQVRERSGPGLCDLLVVHGAFTADLEQTMVRIADWRAHQSEELHTADRFVVAYFGVRTDVQNGGFSQFFENEAGNYWADLLQLLTNGNDAVGVDIFRSVLAIFPESAPALNRSVRSEQLELIEELNSEWDAPFNEQYYERVFPTPETMFEALKHLDDTAYVPLPRAKSG